MGEGVLGFLGGGVAEQFGQLGITQLLRYISEKKVLSIGHALAAEGGLEVGVGAGLGEVHGARTMWRPS